MTTKPNEFQYLDPSQMPDQQILDLRDHLIAQLRWARERSYELINTVPESLWYTIPAGIASHVAWQVGHLAVAQYGLMLFRQRGRAEGDTQLMPGWLRKQFGRGSQPSSSPESMPTPEDLRGHLDAIHQRSIEEASQLSAATLREACDLPYSVYPTKLGALTLVSIHEGIHAGQIGLIRRGHGLEPLR